MTKGKKLYRSRFETRIADQLTKAGIEFQYEAKRLAYESFGQSKKYLPDFWIPRANVFIEVKGFLRADDRWKYENVRKLHPELDLRFCFEDKTQPILYGRMAKMIGDTDVSSVSDWVKGLSWKCCEGTIPQQWINEWR